MTECKIGELKVAQTTTIRKQKREIKYRDEKVEA